MFRFISIFFLTLFCFSSCVDNIENQTKGNIVKNKYAENFKIHEIDNGYIINVYDNNKNLIGEYTLSSNPDYKHNNKSVINIPVTKVICFSSTHCAFIDVLDENHSICGISGTENIYNKGLKKLIQTNKIQEIGFENRIDYEKIISLNPDVIFAYSIDNSSKASLQKFNELNIPVVYVNEFIEPEILGRTEWIKFFACFYDKIDFAKYYCDSVFGNYQRLKESLQKTEPKKPKILCSMPWQGVWWAPGGDSYFAKLIDDAGGKYILKDNKNKESVPYSIEEVFSRSKNADIWLNPNQFNYKQEMLSTDERLEQFKAYKSSKIYNNNNRVNSFGGNDFWESGIVHPDMILKDLIKIFHPGFELEHELFYYKEIH